MQMVFKIFDFKTICGDFRDFHTLFDDFHKLYDDCTFVSGMVKKQTLATNRTKQK